MTSSFVSTPQHWLWCTDTFDDFWCLFGSLDRLWCGVFIHSWKAGAWQIAFCVELVPVYINWCDLAVTIATAKGESMSNWMCVKFKMSQHSGTSRLYYKPASRINKIPSYTRIRPHYTHTPHRVRKIHWFLAFQMSLPVKDYCVFFWFYHQLRCLSTVTFETLIFANKFSWQILLTPPKSLDFCHNISGELQDGAIDQRQWSNLQSSGWVDDGPLAWMHYFYAPNRTKKESLCLKRGVIKSDLICSFLCHKGFQGFSQCLVNLCDFSFTWKDCMRFQCSFMVMWWRSSGFSTWFTVCLVVGIFCFSGLSLAWL